MKEKLIFGILFLLFTSCNTYRIITIPNENAKEFEINLNNIILSKEIYILSKGKKINVEQIEINNVEKYILLKVKQKKSYLKKRTDHVYNEAIIKCVPIDNIQNEFKLNFSEIEKIYFTKSDNKVNAASIVIPIALAAIITTFILLGIADSFTNLFQ